MNSYKLPKDVDNWDLENGFYLTCKNNRMSEYISHLELYKMILNRPGEVAEFGVFKGSSLIQFLSFREYYENFETREIIGFDVFGDFPSNVDLNSDKAFINEFTSEGGNGISKSDLDMYLKNKNFKNYQLIKGDIIDSLPRFLEDNPEKRFAMVHIDVDVYEATKCILENIWEKVVKGGLVLFDDYGIVDGGTKAIDEFFSGKDIVFQQLKYKYKPAFVIKN